MKQARLCELVDALFAQVESITRALDKYDLLDLTGEARFQGSTWEVSASQIASWVAGESLPLENTDHYVRLKDGNLEIRGGKFDIHTGESGARLQMDGEGMIAWDAGDVETFNLDFTTGALTLTGTITAAAGSIGGWTINADNIAKNDATLHSDGYLLLGTGDDIIVLDALGDHRVYIGNANAALAPFSVTKAGAIKATSGDIAGWTLSATVLEKLAANVGIILDSTTPKIQVGDTGGTHIELEGASGHVGTSDFSSGVRGWRIEQDGDAEFLNIVARGVFRTPVFLKDEVTSIGGTFLVAESDVLSSDCTTAAVDASFDFICPHNYFAVNDYVRCKPSGTRQFWALITAIAGAGPYTYSATMKSGNTATAFYAGEAVVNYGASGAGAAQMTATAANSPYLDIFTHAGAPWTTLTHRVRLGNLEGVEAGGGYGLWADNVFLTGKITATDGDFSAVDISGLLTMLSGGEIRIGDGGTPGADFNGLRLYQTAAPLYRLEGQSSGTVQAYFDSDGMIKCGAGAVVLGENGLYLVGSGAAGAPRSFRFYDDSIGSNKRMGVVYASWGGGAAQCVTWITSERIAADPWPAGNAVCIQASDAVAGTDYRIQLDSSGLVQIGGTEQQNTAIWYGFNTIVPEVVNLLTIGAGESVLNLKGDAGEDARIVAQGDYAMLDLVDLGGGANDKWLQYLVDGGIGKWQAMFDAGGVRTANILSVDMGTGSVGMARGLSLGEVSACNAGELRYTDYVMPKRGASYYDGRVVVDHGQIDPGGNITLTTSYQTFMTDTQTVPAGYLFVVAHLTTQAQAITKNNDVVARLVVDTVVKDIASVDLHQDWEQLSMTVSWVGAVAAGSKTWYVEVVNPNNDASQTLVCAANVASMTWFYFT